MAPSSPRRPRPGSATPKGRPRPPAPRPGRGPAGRRPLLAALVATVLVLIGGWAAMSVGSDDAEASCRGASADLRLTAPSEVGTLPLDDSQIANADTIVRTAMRTGRSPQAATLALATAMQESALLNIDHGDEAGPDSRGLFQQRLQFYDHIDVMDPAEATEAFLDGLDDVPGWQDLPPADAIQSVQRSAHPHLYADWVGPARGWTDALWSYAEACALPGVTSTATTAAS